MANVNGGAAASAIVATKPNDTAPERKDADVSDTVEVRHRGRLASLLSMLSCCSKSSMSKSIHFHANRIEDSVHVMLKHDKVGHQRRGEPQKGYTPRESLSDRIAACRKMETERKEASRPSAIEAEEDDGDNDILAAVSKADCVSGNLSQ